MPSFRILIQSAGSKLTERRIRAHALVLAICLWSAYGIDLATPGLCDRAGMLKGADFMHLYTLGVLANRGQGRLLYDMKAQAELMPALVPASAGLVYIPLYGPQVSLLFAPLARLGYVPALLMWWLISAALYATSCYLVWSTFGRNQKLELRASSPVEGGNKSVELGASPPVESGNRKSVELRASSPVEKNRAHIDSLRNHGTTVFIAAAAFPGFFALLAWGQSTAPAVLAIALAYLALRADRRFLAGLAIGLLAFKPSLGVGFGLVFLIAAEWKIVAGALLSAAAQLSIGWLHYGRGVMIEYWNALRSVPERFGYVEPKVYMVHSLRAFWAMLVPNAPVALTLYFVSAGLALVMAILVWRSRASLKIRFSAVLLTTVLVAPHLTIYDLVILAPAFLLIPEWLLRTEARHTATIRVLLYLSFLLPLLGPLTRWTHLQLSVIAFGAVLYWMWKLVREPQLT